MKNRKQFIYVAILLFLIIATIIGIAVITGVDEEFDINNIVMNETTEEQIRCGEPLDAIIYNGIKYCGLGMSWKLEEFPEGFEEIGEFQGALTEANEELTSTMVFRDNEILYHYVDEEGYHYFCAKRKNKNFYIGLYKSSEYNGEYKHATPHKLNDY